MNGQQPRTGSWLLLSVLLNVFLLGGIAGGAWRWWAALGSEEGIAAAAPAAAPRVPAPAAAPAVRGLRFAADGLAPAQRQAFRAGLREVRRDAADLIRASRDGRAEVARLLAAPTFDRSAIDAARAATRAADLALRERVEGQILTFAGTLSPADRATLVQGLSVQPGAFRAPAAPARP